VASKLAPHTEVVVDGETGLLVQVDDPSAFAAGISWLLLHPEEAQRMGQRGQDRVYHYFSAERMAAETLGLYRTLIEAHPIQAPVT
jgi:glycosyltransferase involved in cell wall biosynthesis